MVKEGHKYEDIIDGYSHDFVVFLVDAVLQNKKMEAISHAMSTLIAVSHALDISFNKGKGRIFDIWREGLLGESPVATSSFSKPQKQLMSNRFEEFLFTMPSKGKDS